MPQRMLAAQSRIWDRFRTERTSAWLPPVIAVLISHAPAGWTAARSFEELFHPAVISLPGLAALTPRFSLITLDLARLSHADLQVRALDAPQKLALWLLRDARDPDRLLDSFEIWRPVWLDAGQGRSGLDTLEVLIQYMFQVVGRRNLRRLRAKIRTLDLNTEEIVMTIADSFREEGREEGHEQGLQQGRLATLRSQLLYKFQSLDAASEARLQAATPEAINRYLQRVLFADSLAAVFAD